MKKFILNLLFLLFVSVSCAQSIAGTWYAAMLTPAGKYILVFHIKEDKGSYSATMDNPAQRITNVPVASTAFVNSQLTMVGPGALFAFKGKFNPDSNNVKGTYTQGGIGFPMTFARHASGLTRLRPQDPQEFPYIREEITIPNADADVELAGTLTMPRDGKASKIVVLVTGSGPENRNEELFDHRPFLVMSDWLTRHGIAVIRCDDRGVGESTGDFISATTYDFADDAAAIVNYIRLRPDLKRMKIGLIGHSEGGVMVSIAALKSDFVNFVVLLASPGIPLKRILIEEAELSAGGNAISSLDEQLYNYIINNPALSAAEINAGLDAIIYKEAARTPDGTIQGLSAKAFSDLCKGQGFSGPWFRNYVALEPARFISKLRCPVLALNGTLDMVVRCDENLNAIKVALQAGGNKNFDIAALKDLNHLFQKTTAGPAVPYDQINETLNAELLLKISDWINALK